MYDLVFLIIHIHLDLAHVLSFNLNRTGRIRTVMPLLLPL